MDLGIATGGSLCNGFGLAPYGEIALGLGFRLGIDVSLLAGFYRVGQLALELESPLLGSFEFGLQFAAGGLFLAQLVLKPAGTLISEGAYRILLIR